MDDYMSYDGLGLAQLVRKGQVSPMELLEQAILRLEAVNPKINAVVTKMYDHARGLASCGKLSGPFAGVPFLLKDLEPAYAGFPLSMGCEGAKGYVPQRHAEIVNRFLGAGLVPFGKTNCPEFGLMGVTEPRAWGPTRNPWDTRHTSGGSSGGSGAAVAAGVVPMASGGDGGGSIRIPASCCGLFGLKPSRGRTPTGPDQGEVWFGAVVNHGLTRSVRDSAALLDVLRGPDVGAPYNIAPPPKPYTDLLQNHPGQLKVAMSTLSPLQGQVHPDCVQAVEDTALLLEDLGHRVVQKDPPVDGRQLMESYMLLNFGEVAAMVRGLRQKLGRPVGRRDVEPGTRALALLGNAYSAGDFVEARHCWNLASRAMGTFFESYDLVLTPTLAHPPVAVGSLQPKLSDVFFLEFVDFVKAGKLLKALGLVQKVFIQNLEKMPFTQLANLTGIPAMSVPLGTTASGLPCGVQLMAAFGREDQLLQVAVQLEKAKPWFDHMPRLELGH